MLQSSKYLLGFGGKFSNDSNMKTTLNFTLNMCKAYLRQSVTDCKSCFYNVLTQESNTLHDFALGQKFMTMIDAMSPMLIFSVIKMKSRFCLFFVCIKVDCVHVPLRRCARSPFILGHLVCVNLLHKIQIKKNIECLWL